MTAAVSLLPVSAQPQKEQCLHWGMVEKRNLTRTLCATGERYGFLSLHHSQNSWPQPHPLPSQSPVLLSCDYCHHLPFTEKAKQSLLWVNPVSLGCAWELLRVSTLRLMYAVTLCVWCRGTESQHPGVHDEGYGKTRSVWCTEVNRAGDGRKEEG